MGNFKSFWIFGYEWWGRLCPEWMKMADGKYFKPLFLGLWIRIKKPLTPLFETFTPKQEKILLHELEGFGNFCAPMAEPSKTLTPDPPPPNDETGRGLHIFTG